MARRTKKSQQTVWIVNRSAHDFSDAARFGRLEYLSEGLLRKRNVAYMFRLFNSLLADSSPNDYLLPTSLTIMCIIAAVIFALKHNRLNLLLFEEGHYKARSLVFSNDGELMLGEKDA